MKKDLLRVAHGPKLSPSFFLISGILLMAIVVVKVDSLPQNPELFAYSFIGVAIISIGLVIKCFKTW